MPIMKTGQNNDFIFQSVSQYLKPFGQICLLRKL
jgi:hypothetical protein